MIVNTARAILKQKSYMINKDEQIVISLLPYNPCGIIAPVPCLSAARRQKSMRLQGKTIAYLVAQEVEDLEFWVPVMRLREEGARVIIIGLSTQMVHGKHGLEMTPDVSITEAPKAAAFDGIVIPGGWAPDKLRRHQ